MELFVFLLTVYGITNIVIFGSIFESMRNFFNKFSPKFFGKLFSCPMCLSFWVGVLMTALMDYLNHKTPWSSIGDNLFILSFLNGCLSSGVIWIIHNVEEWFERN